MLYTDSAEMYRDLNGEFVHKFVDHLSEYANWRVHTNGMENF
jgi:ISXO2-like transposase domain